ncbi:MAG: divergent PAP2 family protein [Candidatus Woesearchaeota archaeon]|nr:divergent PAP2 family protein [Candidatus Woesearchaeota archaeon]
MNLLQNPVFLTLLLAGIGGQVFKLALYGIKHGFHFRDLITTGGMPSVHVALMIGLTLSIYLSEGATTVFFVSLVVLCIVIVDALGVRRTVGEEGMILHRLIKQTKLHIKEPHYSLGHTPAQVIVGIIWGIVATGIVFVLL